MGLINRKEKAPKPAVQNQGKPGGKLSSLLMFETHNFLRQKSFYVLMAAMLILLSLINNTPEGRLEYYIAIGYGAEDMIVSALSSCFFTIFAGIIAAVCMGRDYEADVIKNVYAKGYTKSQVYTAKFIFTLIIMAVMYIITMAVGVAEAYSVFGKPGMNMTAILLGQLVGVLAYGAFFCMVCHVLKKSAFAIVVIVLLPMVGELVLGVIDSYLHLGIYFTDLWITQTLAFMTGGTITGQDIALAVTKSIVYIVICYFAGRTVNNRQEK